MIQKNDSNELSIGYLMLLYLRPVAYYEAEDGSLKRRAFTRRDYVWNMKIVSNYEIATPASHNRSRRATLKLAREYCAQEIDRYKFEHLDCKTYFKRNQVKKEESKPCSKTVSQ